MSHGTLNTANEIKNAVDNGFAVRCNGNGRVLFDGHDYLIKFESGLITGLTGQQGTRFADKLNGSGFHVILEA